MSDDIETVSGNLPVPAEDAPKGSVLSAMLAQLGNAFMGLMDKAGVKVAVGLTVVEGGNADTFYREHNRMVYEFDSPQGSYAFDFDMRTGHLRITPDMRFLDGDDLDAICEATAHGSIERLAMVLPPNNRCVTLEGVTSVEYVSSLPRMEHTSNPKY